MPGVNTASINVSRRPLWPSFETPTCANGRRSAPQDEVGMRSDFLSKASWRGARHSPIHLPKLGKRSIRATAGVSNHEAGLSGRARPVDVRRFDRAPFAEGIADQRVEAEIDQLGDQRV